MREADLLVTREHTLSLGFDAGDAQLDHVIFTVHDSFLSRCCGIAAVEKYLPGLSIRTL